MRTQIVRRHVAPEMLALGVMELILTFTLSLILLSPSSQNISIASVHLAMTCACSVCFTAFVIGLYRPQMFERARSLLFSTALSAVLSFPLIWLISKGVGLDRYWPTGYDQLRPIKIVLIWSSGVFMIRLLFLAAARFDLFLHRVAVVGRVESPSVSAAVRAGRKGFLEISVTEVERASIELLSRAGIRTLVLSTENMSAFSSELILSYRHHGIKVQAESDFWQHYLRRVNIASLDAQSEAAPTNHVPIIVSRIFDIIVSLSLLIATLPIICIVAIVIRLDTPGSVLYRQERVGLRGASFTLLKFRSMRTDAEALGPRWAQQKDSRVTRVGLFMRKTRVDELPQLLNILHGEMSFIGPRPERPHFVEQLTKVIPNYQQRSRVKPGLTGWAQVNYPYGASVDDARAKLSYDLYYVNNRTIILDFVILLSTVRVILFQEGAR